VQLSCRWSCVLLWTFTTSNSTYFNMVQIYNSRININNERRRRRRSTPTLSYSLGRHARNPNQRFSRSSSVPAGKDQDSSAIRSFRSWPNNRNPYISDTTSFNKQHNGPRGTIAETCFVLIKNVTLYTRRRAEGVKVNWMGSRPYDIASLRHFMQRRHEIHEAGWNTSGETWFKLFF
jgi:hypothetical protein